jgi:uncharacterized protein YbjT (DUF2867 family)
MPVIFLLGAGGFIGGRLVRTLEQAGHRVVRGRRPETDFSRPIDLPGWQERLRGADVVINTVGIFRESRDATFDAVHVQGPRALFEACAALRLSVVQFSALGADEHAASRFHRTKKQADDALLALDVPSIVLQPSLVYGPGGASARLFSALASLPVIPLPDGGGQAIQPVHVDDVCAAVLAIVERRHYPKARMPLVGPEAITLRAFLADLRRAMGLGEARFVALPQSATQLLAAIGGRFGLMLDRDALQMLRRGNTGDPGPLAALLGHSPRPARQFVDEGDAKATLTFARLAWLLPLLRVTVALVWIVAGVVSLGLYPVEQSLALLARTGLTGGLAYAALYGAALLDLVLGAATLLMRDRRLWLVQFMLVLGYTLIITFALPEQWLHPFGPIAKNLPFLAALLLLYNLEER